MGLFEDDKYQDRAWDWAKDFSRRIMPAFKKIFPQLTDTMQSGTLTPWGQSVLDYGTRALAPYAGEPKPVSEDDTYGLVRNLMQPFIDRSQTAPQDSDLYKTIAGLYDRTTEPLYDQMLDPMKRVVESQYQNAMNQALAGGLRGGALDDIMASVGVSRAQALGDIEKELRAKDLLRADATQQARAEALMNALLGMDARNQQLGLTAAGALGNAGLGIDQMQRQQGLLANQYLTNLRQQLSESDIGRAMNFINQGIQGRYLTGNSLAQQEAAGNAQMFGGLLNMMSTLGLGLGMGMGGSSGGLFGGMLGGLFGGAGGGMSPGMLLGMPLDAFAGLYDF